MFDAPAGGQGACHCVEVLAVGQHEHRVDNYWIQVAKTLCIAIAIGADGQLVVTLGVKSWKGLPGSGEDGKVAGGVFGQHSVSGTDGGIVEGGPVGRSRGYSTTAEIDVVEVEVVAVVFRCETECNVLSVAVVGRKVDEVLSPFVGGTKDDGVYRSECVTAVGVVHYADGEYPIAAVLCFAVGVVGGEGHYEPRRVCNRWQGKVVAVSGGGIEVDAACTAQDGCAYGLGVARCAATDSSPSGRNGSCVGGIEVFAIGGDEHLGLGFGADGETTAGAHTSSAAPAVAHSPSVIAWVEGSVNPDVGQVA